MLRVETLIPFFYNDGSLIPMREHYKTFSEIYKKFKAYTLLPPCTGVWKNNKEKLVRDKSSVLIVDIENKELNWFLNKKKVWEKRYIQDIIYIINYPVKQID